MWNSQLFGLVRRMRRTTDARGYQAVGVIFKAVTRLHHSILDFSPAFCSLMPKVLHIDWNQFETHFQVSTECEDVQIWSSHPSNSDAVNMLDGTDDVCATGDKFGCDVTTPLVRLLSSAVFRYVSTSSFISSDFCLAFWRNCSNSSVCFDVTLFVLLLNDRLPDDDASSSFSLSRDAR